MQTCICQDFLCKFTYNFCIRGQNARTIQISKQIERTYGRMQHLSKQIKQRNRHRPIPNCQMAEKWNSPEHWFFDDTCTIFQVFNRLFGRIGRLKINWKSPSKSIQKQNWQSQEKCSSKSEAQKLCDFFWCHRQMIAHFFWDWRNKNIPSCCPKQQIQSNFRLQVWP